MQKKSTKLFKISVRVANNWFVFNDYFTNYILLPYTTPHYVGDLFWKVEGYTKQSYRMHSSYHR